MSRRYTQATREAILEGIRRGLSRGTAAKAVGVAESTVRYWADVHPAFKAQLDQAEAESQSLYMGIILKAAASAMPNTWQAAAWVLERRWPDQFAQRQRVDVSIETRDLIRRGAEEDGVAESDLMAEAEAVAAAAIARGGSLG